MEMTAPGGDDVMTIEQWSSLSAGDPGLAAAELHKRVEALPVSQQRAVFAHLVPEQRLAHQFRQAHQCGGPLAGVPYALKDLFDLRGTHTGAGSSFLHEVSPPAPSDARLVQALCSRGAVCAAKTQLHEFAYGLTGENPFHGNVDNPAAPGGTTGGSSSGSAAAVAAGIVPFSIGTDTGGSVRVPAAFCGLLGYRMTPGHPWISDAFPLAPSCDTAGWFTATAGDMALLCSLLAHARPARAGDRTPRGCRLKIGRLDPLIGESFERQAGAFAPAADHETATALRRALEHTASAYSVLTSSEAASIHKKWLPDRADRYSPVVLSRIQRGLAWSETQALAAASARQFARDTLASFFLVNDFLVLPAVPCPGLAHGDCASFDRERLLDLTAPASLAGLPVLTLPRRDAQGRPQGALQVLLPNLESPVPAWLLANPGLWQGL